MDTIIVGDGGLGRAIATAFTVRDGVAPALLGRPASGRHPAEAFRGGDVVIEASSGDAVARNLEAAIDGGCRRFVIATTAWDVDRLWVTSLIRGADAAAVVAPNLALGAAVFLRLVDEATRRFATLPGFDPFVLEWHRRAKADRPSGTAREIARRMGAIHPAGEPEVASLRAGASPGMHLVGFDAAGETVELRLTARDRSAYAAGALAAADWLRAERRPAGLHPFESVVDDLLAPGAPPSAAPAASPATTDSTAPAMA